MHSKVLVTVLIIFRVYILKELLRTVERQMRWCLTFDPQILESTWYLSLMSFHHTVRLRGFFLMTSWDRTHALVYMLVKMGMLWLTALLHHVFELFKVFAYYRCFILLISRVLFIINITIYTSLKDKLIFKTLSLDLNWFWRNRLFRNNWDSVCLYLKS